MNDYSKITTHLILLSVTVYLAVFFLSLFSSRISRYNQNKEKKLLFEEQYTSGTSIASWLLIVILYFMFGLEDIYWHKINYLSISALIFTLYLLICKEGSELVLIILLVLLLLENFLLIAGFSIDSLSILFMVITIFISLVVEYDNKHK